MRESAKRAEHSEIHKCNCFRTPTLDLWRSASLRAFVLDVACMLMWFESRAVNSTKERRSSMNLIAAEASINATSTVAQVTADLTARRPRQKRQGSLA